VSPDFQAIAYQLLVFTIAQIKTRLISNDLLFFRVGDRIKNLSPKGDRYYRNSLRNYSDSLSI
jgi:hypothetical protein